MDKAKRRTASCPHFMARVDYRGRYFINCNDMHISYHTKEERDANYLAACCGQAERCPIKERTGKQ